MAKYTVIYFLSDKNTPESISAHEQIDAGSEEAVIEIVANKLLEQNIITKKNKVITITPTSKILQVLIKPDSQSQGTTRVVHRDVY